MNIMLLLHILLLTVEIALVAPMLYLLTLSIAALVQRPHQKTNGSTPITHFAVLIPAHNEEATLGTLLSSLNKQEYPSSLVEIHVVADNCKDATAEIARQAGVFVHERKNDIETGKGYALRWLLGQIEAAGRHYDAYAMLDADTEISPNFLQVMDAGLQSGQSIIQSQYLVQNAGETWTAGLRSIAFALFNHLRPLGRTALHWSSGLKGTGMCFSTSVVKQFGWDSFSLTEDVEYHVRLVTAGLRVAYAPAAITWSAMPTTLKTSQSQQMRWERGRLDLVRRHVPHLLWGLLRTGDTALFDAAMEILVPPLAILVGLVICCCVSAFLLPSFVGIRLGIALVVGLTLYVLIGLRLARLPLAAYRSLLFVPVYIVWKFWLYAVALFSIGDRRWIRTTR